MDDFLETPNPTLILIAGRYAARRHPGLQRSRVSEIESGRVEPRWGEIRGLLKALNCEPVLLALGAGYQERPRAEDWDA
jgi:hypothetical protein